MMINLMPSNKKLLGKIHFMPNGHGFLVLPTDILLLFASVILVDLLVKIPIISNGL